MPIDTSIYSRVGKGGNLGDLVNNYNRGYESYQQRKLSDLALSKAEHDAASMKAMNDAYASNIGPDGKISRQGMLSQVAASGHGTAIPQMQQDWSTQDRAEAETRLKQMDAAKKQVDYFNSSLGGLLTLPEVTDDALIRATSDAVNRGFIGQDEAMEFIRTMPPDQAGRRAMIKAAQIQTLDAQKQLEMLTPKVSPQNLGGHTQMVDINPLTNPDVVGQRLDRSATIGEQESARHNRAAEANAARRLSVEQGNATAEAGGPNQVALTRQFGKAPTGYRWKQDGSMESIPGGPADIKAGEIGAKREARLKSQEIQAKNVLNTVSEAKKLVGSSTAGFGGLLANIPNTDARNLAGKLETIKANLGFDRLQQMREESPTGGALGAVAVQELVALQSTVASLDQLQSADQLESALNKIDRHYNNWLKTVSGDSSGKDDNGNQSGSAGSQSADIDALLEKYR